MFSRRATRIAIAVGLTAAVSVLFIVQMREAQVRAGKMVGISLDRDDGPVEVVETVPGMPADRAGLRAGDQILAINGYPLEKLLDYDEAARDLGRDRTGTFRIRRGDQELLIEVQPGVELSVLQHALNGVALAGYLALALLALFQGPGDVRARLLFLFAAAVSLELALPYETIGNPALELAALSVFYLLTGLEVGLELHLASIIPRPYGWLTRRPWLVPAYYTIGILLGGVTCVTYLVEDGLGVDLFPWSSLQTDTALLDVGLPLWAVAVPLILALQAVRAEEPRGRYQAGLVLAGVIPWTVSVFLVTAFTVQGSGVPQVLEAVESLALLAYPLAIFVAIYRYQLFDIEVVVRKGLLYGTMTGAVLLVFYGALGAGSALFSNLVEKGGSVWFVAGVTLVLGLLFAPLRRSLQKVIDRRFFPERHAMRERLIDLAGELPGLAKLPLMGDHLVRRLVKVFAVRSATLLLADAESRLITPLATTRTEDESFEGLLLELDDPAVEVLHRAERPMAASHMPSDLSHNLERWLTVAEAAVVAPLLVRGELTGILILGPKEGRDRFPAEELELLNLLTHHVATVFQNARLFESATFESLTGLLRREAILEALERELDRALRYGRPLTVGMADLDHFKEVNDRYGHLAGDSLLKRVSQVLSGGVRSSDAVGRYGGEEFLLVLPETDLAGARILADKLRRLVEGVHAPMADGETVHVTVSIGLASLGGEDLPDKPTSRDLIQVADRALYRAKEAGRNRIYPPFIVRAG